MRKIVSQKGLINIKNLIITTIPDVTEFFPDAETLYLANYKLGNCIGCTNCWLKTPGMCAIKDDWAIIFGKILKADNVVLVTEAKLGFISYKMKNLIDRLIPIATPYTKLYKGEMRHKPRYDKCWNFGLVYYGDGDKEFLTQWMDRFVLNLYCKSLGVFKLEEGLKLW